MIFLGPLRTEVRAASWFAALGETLTDGDRADARAYAGIDDVRWVTSWREAEDFLKSPSTSLDWWDGEEALRKELLATAQTRYPERAVWTSLTDLTTEAGDLVHGKAAAAAMRLGGAQPVGENQGGPAAGDLVVEIAERAVQLADDSLHALLIRRAPA